MPYATSPCVHRVSGSRYRSLQTSRTSFVVWECCEHFSLSASPGLLCVLAGICDLYLAVRTLIFFRLPSAKQARYNATQHTRTHTLHTHTIRVASRSTWPLMKGQLENSCALGSLSLVAHGAFDVAMRPMIRFGTSTQLPWPHTSMPVHAPTHTCLFPSKLPARTPLKTWATL